MSLANIDWDFDKLEELIEARGDLVIVETGVACTCQKTDHLAGLSMDAFQPTTMEDIYCNICQGDGFIFRNARTVKGLVTSIQAGPNRKLIELGYAVAGDAVFSPSLRVGPLSDFDRVTFLYPDFVGAGQVIKRNAAGLSDLGNWRLDLNPNEDRLYYQAACALWCEDENNVVYQQEADFKLEDKVIKWVGNTPADGVFYTLKYNAYLEWIVYNTPHLRIDRNRSLAQRVLIRKKHVAFSNGSFADTPAKREAEQEAVTSQVTI